MLGPAEAFVVIPTMPEMNDGAAALMRGEWPARWEPQEEGVMSIAASFPSFKKPRLCRSREEQAIRL
jgi:hypothetical protein